MEQNLIEFLSADDVTFDKIDSKNSGTTNFYLFSKQFSKLQPYLKNLKSVVKTIVNQLDISNLTNDVLNNIETNKKLFFVDNSIGQIKDIVIGTITYRVSRPDVNTIQIVNLTNPNWNTDSLFVTVKGPDGTILYPVIKTAEQKISINIANNIFAIYRIYIL